MPRFQRRPTIIEASRWWPGVALRESRSAMGIDGVAVIHNARGGLEMVAPGEWVIVMANGDRCTMTDEAFREMYMPFDEEAQRALDDPGE